MSARADVIVLGAGMVGVSGALHLQRRRRDVVRIAELEGIRDWKIHAAPIEVEAVDLET
jgi:glycine/D-amino acid oxidase-like deaminating enzyme